MSQILSHHERYQLRAISGVYSDGLDPYWWGEKTMPKLAAKGLVEPFPEKKGAWRITAAGRALALELWPDRRMKL